MQFKFNSFIQTVYLLGIIFLCSCSASKRSLNTVLSEKQLRSDVDFTYRKLQKLHPNLYWYISKKELDQKFDSLKASIQTPMTANEFYFKLSPVIAAIRQGHTRLFRDFQPDRTVSRFEYELLDHKLYIIQNNSTEENIKPGTEVISVNNIQPKEIFEKYRNTFSSDGYNETFINRILCKTFESSFRFENVRSDSLVFQLKYNDTIRNVSFYKPAPDSAKAKKLKSIPFRDTELKFMGPDSSIALMKIRDFSGFNSLFYKRSFVKINQLKSKVLILDLRDNLGGRIREVYNLYSYLTDDYYYFIDIPEICSRTSLLNTGEFRSSTLSGKAFLLTFTPLRLVKKWYMLNKIERGPDAKFYYDLYESNTGEPNPVNFNGKIYVIINGGCFSATCLLASNLKGSKRAFFVGEETGGAYNGTVAGMLPRLKLPNSQLNISIGLMVIKPYYKTDISGRGIYPDVEIKPTPDDLMNGNDPELQWILKDIEKHKKPVNNKGTIVSCL